MKVVVNNYLTNYSIVGSGPNLLFIHGWGDRYSTFSRLIEKLQDSQRIILLDLPGFGESEPPNEVYDLSKYADFVVEFLKKINVSKIEAIIGHSNGGAIAIKMLSSHLVKSDKLVLIASSGIRTPLSHKNTVLRVSAKIIKQPIKLLPIRSQSKIKKRMYSKLGSDLYTAEHLQDTFKKVVSEDLRNIAGEIAIPTLLIYGDDDSSTPSEFGKIYKNNIRNAELKILPGAGHFLHQTHVSEVSNLIKEFIEI